MTTDGERLAAYVGRVQRLLRELAPGPGAVLEARLRTVTEGLAEQSRWAMLLAERLDREEDDGR